MVGWEEQIEEISGGWLAQPTAHPRSSSPGRLRKATNRQASLDWAVGGWQDTMAEVCRRRDTSVFDDKCRKCRFETWPRTNRYPYMFMISI
jgi:hypothetical protein